MIRRRRVISAALISLVVLLYGVNSEFNHQNDLDKLPDKQTSSIPDNRLASNALGKLAVKGRAPKTGYSREQFGGGWGQIGGCDVRNLILRRDMTKLSLDEEGCIVSSGQLKGPYTAKTINFKRGVGSSNKVQIDHVVALSDAWQKGAQGLSEKRRLKLANDSLNLLAVDGKANIEKSDGDAATWLPPNKEYRCRYIARQIAVKIKYLLWVTSAEKSAMGQVLNKCPTQQLPKVEH